MDKIQTDKQTSQQVQPTKGITPALALLAKDVNRKEFLSIMGFGSLAIIGIAPLIHFFTGKSSKTVTHLYRNQGSATAYSRGSYNK